MQGLNSRFAILEARGSPSTYISREDFLPIQESDLRRRLSGEAVQSGTGKKGEPAYMCAFKYWTGNAGRHVYRRVVFTSEPQSGDAFNLFRGLGVKPRPGECGLILRHIEEVICSGDKKNFDAMLKLLAWQLQNIGKPSRTIPVLKSAQQQIGKGILLGEIMAKIYGPRPQTSIKSSGASTMLFAGVLLLSVLWIYPPRL
jgi:hypothetical protein